MTSSYLNLYIDFLKNFLHSQRKLKIVFDCSNGSTGLILKPLLRGNKLIRARFINDQPDGNFPAHGPNPLADGATDQLIAEVRKRKADLGVILDNDGDRVFFVDETGRQLTATETIIFLGRGFKGNVVVDFMIGPLAYEVFKKQNREVFTSRVGTYFIKKTMGENKATFAGEYSGHYYFKEFFNSDSGVMAAVYFINRLSKIRNSTQSSDGSSHRMIGAKFEIRNLSDWLSRLPRYYQKMINLEYEREKFPELAKRLETEFKSRALKISHLDGVKIEFPKYWFNLRPSNTEDLIRLTVEATTKELLDEKVIELKDVLAAFQSG